MDSLPGPFQPSDYQLRANAEYLNGEFGQASGQSGAEFLVTGPELTEEPSTGSSRPERPCGTPPPR